MEIKCVRHLGGLSFEWEINGKKLVLSIGKEKGECILYDLIEELKQTLISNVECKELVEKSSFFNVSTICMELWPDLTSRYLNYWLQGYTKRRTKLSQNQLYFDVFGIELSYIKCWHQEFKELIEKAFCQEYEKQKEQFIVTNLKEMSIANSKWTMYWVKGTGLRSRTYDFTEIKKETLRYEVRHYFLQKLKGRDNYRSDFGLALLTRGLNFITDCFENVQHISDVNSVHVNTLVIHLLSNSQNWYGKKLAASSASDVIQNCSLLTEWLMESKALTPVPRRNYFGEITFKNIKNLYAKTESIPDVVIDQILLHINELKVYHQRIFIVAINCGLRFKEVAYLEKDCLTYDSDNQCWVLSYVPWKVLEARRRNGLEDFHKIPIFPEVADEINAQIKDSTLDREKSQLKQIFINIVGNYRYSIVQCNAFDVAVRRLIRKYDVRDENGELWHFTSRQCRKTVAVDMITAGALPSEVSNHFNHLDIKTTNNFYSEVRKIKLAEKNADFFRKKFELVVGEKQLARFNDVERIKLYEDFCLGQREVELGVCLRHISDGPCNNRSGDMTCATCKYLCTGQKNLPKWLVLRDSQRNIVNGLVIAYQSEGIDNFEEFTEYKKEQYFLNAYEEIINRITEFVKKG